MSLGIGLLRSKSPVLQPAFKIRSRSWLRNLKRKSLVVRIRKPMSESFEPPGPSKKVRAAVGRQILSAGCASGAPKPASTTTTTAFQTRQSQKKNPPG
jgi:hypothetical protein